MAGLAREVPARPVRDDDVVDIGEREITPSEAIGAINPAAGIAVALLNPQTYEDQAIGYRYGRYRDNLAAQRIARVEAYDELIDEIHRETGTRLPNPEDERFWDVLGSSSLMDRYGTVANDPVARFEFEVARVLNGRPGAEAYLARARREAMETRAETIRREATDRFHDYTGAGGDGLVDQLVRGLQLTPGLIAGALSTGSPEQVAQLGAGGAGRLAGVALGPLERVGVRFGLGASSNVVAQAGIEPALIEDARRMGETYDAPMVALDFAIAALFGGTIEAAPAIGRREPQLPGVVASTPRDTVSTFDEPGSGAEVQRAATGRAESLLVASHQRDRVTSLELPQDVSVEGLVDSINANDRFVRGETAEAPVSDPPPRPVDAREAEAIARQADDAPSPAAGTREMVTMNGRSRPRTFTRFSPQALEFDAATFQYKRSEGQQGSTGRLQGVGAWDGQSSGKLVVWKREDDTNFVADGHQRVALAQRLQSQTSEAIWLDAFVYRQSDGWTAAEVRNIAAQKNLRETTGDVLDTASLMRDAPELIDASIPQRGADFRQAKALARLSDEAFAAVRAGQIDERLGAIIGEVAGERPETHAALVQLFRKNPPATLRDAAFIAREATMAHVYRQQTAQMSMFGDDLVISGMQERAVILRNAATMLREDKRVFMVAERNSDTLEAAGNVLAPEANRRRAQLADALINEIDVLATRPGLVSDALREISARAAEQKLSASVAAREFVQRVEALLDQHGLLGLKQGADARPVGPAPPARIEEMAPRLEAEARSAVLRSAHDLDEEILAQSMAEVALERAMRGELGDVIPEDAIGHTPEADIARIEEAAEALGIDADFTEVQVAAAILARPDATLEAEARARLEPVDIGAPDAAADAGEPVPNSFADIAEHSTEVEAPWTPTDFDDAAKLQEAIDQASLPELEAIAREKGFGGVPRTRKEYARAFHGSPYNFDRFDLGHIGSGEGAQSYGHGLYFAENEKVATAYRDGLSAVSEQDIAALLSSHGVDDPSATASEIAYFWEKFKGNDSWATIVRTVRETRGNLSDEQIAGFEMVAESPPPSIGRLYEVTLPDGPYLDWDQPLSRQAPELRDALTKLNEEWEFPWNESTKGIRIYADMADILGVDVELGGQNPYLVRGGDDRRASEALRAAGIVGIRYLDQGSRGSGDGTHNLVVFSDRDVEIVAKDGQPVSKTSRDEILSQHQPTPEGWERVDTTTDNPPKMTVEQAHNAARAAFPRISDKVLENGRLTIVQTVDDLPIAEELSARDKRNIQGYAANGRAYIVAGNVNAEAMRGLIVHEVGAHVGMRAMLGERGYEQVIAELARLRDDGDADVERGYNAARSVRTAEASMDDEALAYALQYAEMDEMSPGLRGLVMRVINSVRAWWWRTFPSMRFAGTLTFEDMRWMAAGALRHVANKKPREFGDGRWFARGDAADRGSVAFNDARLNAQQNKVVEMARNNYTNAEIMDEMDFNSVGQVSVLLSQAKKRVPGLAIPAGRRGNPGGVYRATGERTATTAEIVALRRRLERAGMNTKSGANSDAINRVIAERLGGGLTANAVASRLSKHNRALLDQADALDAVVAELRNCK